MSDTIRCCCRYYYNLNDGATSNTKQLLIFTDLKKTDSSVSSYFPLTFCRRLQMSLADELLADLEEAGDEGEEGLYPEEEERDSDGEATQGRAEGALEDIPEEMEVDYSKAESVGSIAKLRNSKQVSCVTWELCAYIMSNASVLTFISVYSFQRSWRKFHFIVESSARTQRVSVTSVHVTIWFTKFLAE